jgi:hypothetical protein
MPLFSGPRVRLYAIVAIVSLTGTSPCQTAVCDTDCLTAKIVQARDYTAQYVVLAKQSFKANSPEYNQAFKLYATAYSNYGAWDAYLSSALRAGRAKKLNKDQNYNSIAAQAAQSSLAFTTYVDTNTSGDAKQVTTILASLANLGLQLWTGISQHLDQERVAAANAFDNATKWQAWNEITDGSAPKSTNTDGSTPKSTTLTTTTPQTKQPKSGSTPNKSPQP